MHSYYRQFVLAQRSAGFTLIEIIVVVAIIGVVVALIGVNLSRDTDRLARLEAQRFHVIVNEVRDEAIIAGGSFLLVINDRSNHYRFDSVGDTRQADANDGLLKVRNIEPGVTLDWDVFDQIEDVGTTPRVLISPLGEITPFDARFIGDENNYHVFVNDQNQLEQRTERGSL